MTILKRSMVSRINRAIRPVSRLSVAKRSNPPVFSGWLFSRLIDHYFSKGMAKLIENLQHIVPLTEQLLAVPDDQQGQLAVDDLENNGKEWGS